MINKKLLFISTLVLALSPFIASNSWANSHEPKAVEKTVDVATKKAIDDDAKKENDESKENCLSEDTFKALSAEDKVTRIAERCEGSE